MDNIEAHNRYQQLYFGRGIKPTMLPRRTPYVLRHVAEVIRAGDLHPGDRVLEVGFGMGRHAFIMADMGLHVEGIELSPFLIDQFRRFNAGRYQIPVYQGDLHRMLQSLYSRFSAVVGFFVLHHAADIEVALAEMAKALTPGGRMIFVEPNPYNPLFYIQILITPGMSWRAERGITRLRRSVLERAVERAGLEGPFVRHFGLFPPILANRRWGAGLERMLERLGHWGALWAFQIIRVNRP